jgi:hypothetical protein
MQNGSGAQRKVVWFRSRRGDAGDLWWDVVYTLVKFEIVDNTYRAERILPCRLWGTRQRFLSRGMINAHLSSFYQFPPRLVLG